MATSAAPGLGEWGEQSVPEGANDIGKNIVLVAGEEVGVRRDCWIGGLGDCSTECDESDAVADVQAPANVLALFEEAIGDQSDQL